MTSIDLPNLSKLEGEGSKALEAVKSYHCRTEAEYVSCGTFFRWVKARQKEIKNEPEFKELLAKKSLLHKMHSDASTLERKVLQPYVEAETAIENVMRPYVIEKRQKEDEEKRRLQAQADAAAAEEKELLRLQAEIEGRPEEAAILEQLLAVAPEVHVEKAVPKTEGMSTRGKWRWEVVDRTLIPGMWWVLNEKMISNHVNTLGDKVDIPGIKVIPDVSFAG